MPTLRQFCDLIGSDLPKALSRRLNAGIETFGKLAASFREVYIAHARLNLRPSIHCISRSGADDKSYDQSGWYQLN